MYICFMSTHNILKIVTINDLVDFLHLTRLGYKRVYILKFMDNVSKLFYIFKY